MGNSFEERPTFDKDDNSEAKSQLDEVVERSSSKDSKPANQSTPSNEVTSEPNPTSSQHPALTYEQLLEENKRLREELEQRDAKIRKLDEENIKIRDAEAKRNKEFQGIKNEHSVLLTELESLRGGGAPPQLTEKPHDEEDEEDKLIKL